MKINILDKHVYNRIAAGEVVERPFSVVKELVENSLDAGASNITVRIQNGGKDCVSVEDDGCGIEKDELYKAFMPHATSKIKDVGDLDEIMTLGFRGEALASIASVARVTIVSKPKEQEFGAKIFCDGGNIGETTDSPSNNGTKVTVESLFFNTPVRAGFMKSSKAEEADITDIIGRLILANPEIAFKYYADDRLVLQSFGGGAEEALIAVYGASAVRNCFKIHSVKNGIEIEGYVGKHNFTKPNRTYQTLIINGRYVVNATVSAAMQNAYRSYLMKRQYPFYVLNLKLPIGVVDVNVHPNKTDVRFKDNQIVFGAVYSVVSKVLDGTDEALNIVKEMPPSAVMPDIKSDKNEYNKRDFDDSENDIAISEENRNEPVITPPRARLYSGDAIVFHETPAQQTASAERERRIIDVFSENKKYLEELEQKAQLGKLTEEVKQMDLPLKEELNYIGQAFKTYLIFQMGEDLYFVDQHAAHERILFDILIKNATERNRESQPLLVPYILNLNGIENGYFQTRLSFLEEMGFAIEYFGGNSYKVTEVPLSVSEIDLGSFFADILSDYSLKQEKIPEIIREKLCQRACKAAIKSGFDITKPEIDIIVNKLKENMGLKCPHGRPVAVKITRLEIDKWFKRIV